MSKWIKPITKWTCWTSSTSTRLETHGLFSSEPLSSVLPNSSINPNKNEINKPKMDPVIRLIKSHEFKVDHLSCTSTAVGGRCDVFLLGINHFCPKSCREVEKVIRALQPEVVFLELCPSRESVINQEYSKSPGWKTSISCSGSSYIMNSQYGSPRSEFLVAKEEALKYGGKLVLGDRPISITNRRILAAMGIWERIKYLYKFYPSKLLLPNFFLHKLTKKNTCVKIDNVHKEFPTLMKTIGDERDQYMAGTLLITARKHDSVVAVVGYGHVAGIKKYWKQPIDFQRLMETPRKAVSAVKVVACLYGLVAGAAAILGSGFTIPFYVALSLPYFLRMYDVIVMAK